MVKREHYRTAIVQNKPLRNTEASIAAALDLINTAAQKAGLVILPEMFTTPYEFALMRSASQFSSAALEKCRETAARHSVFICCGSMPVMRGNTLSNTSYLISDTGLILYEYDKCHLFDVRLPEITVSESRIFSPGNSLKLAQTSIGCIGTIICYDIRFPELARRLTLDGMQLLCVPAAFSTTTGPAHWHTVMRARAIENQIYVCAASPARDADSAYPAYGHSMIVDPWGKIIAEAGHEETIIYADISLEMVSTIRKRMPLLEHRRAELY